MARTQRSTGDLRAVRGRLLGMERRPSGANVRRRLLAGLLLACFTALAGACGSNDSTSPSSSRKPPPAIPAQQRDVLGAIDQLQAASRRGDGARICQEIFTAKLARSVAASSRKPCPKEVTTRLFPPTATLAVGQNIRVSGGRAVADVMDQNGKRSTLVLVKEGGRWRIDQVRP